MLKTHLNDNSNLSQILSKITGQHAIEEQIEGIWRKYEMEYTRRWVQSCRLYSRAGMADRCIGPGDLQFSVPAGQVQRSGHGLKMQYQPLSPSQRERYDGRSRAG